MRDQDKTKEQLVNELAEMRQRIAELEEFRARVEQRKGQNAVDDEDPHLVDGQYSIGDLVDLEKLHEIFERFSLATGFTTGFVEYPTQEILITTGWRDICTKFHRVCQESVKHCKESNVYLTQQLKELKELSIKPCGNGLVDGATPIIIRGKHIASLFTGQVLFEEPNIEQFRKQAEIYGYDLDGYLNALSRVPVVSEEQFKNILTFLSEIAVVIAELGFHNLAIQKSTKRLREEIVERKQTEEALRESEERYRKFVETSPDAIAISDLKGHITFVSPITLALFGAESKDDVLGTSVLDWITPEEHEKAIENIGKVLKGESLSSNQYTLLAGDGKRLFGEINSNVLQDADGNPAAMISIIRDITDRKQAEEEIQKRIFEQEMLREAMLALTTTLNRDEVIDRILAQLQEVVPYDTASVQLLQNGCLEIVGGRGFPNLEELLGVTFDPNREDNPNRAVVLTQASFIVDDTSTVYDEFLREPHASADIRSWLGVPMLVGERMLGMIALDKREPGFYSSEHARLAEAFAAQAAIAIENARLFEQAQQEIVERKQAEVALHKQTHALRESEERAKQRQLYLERVLAAAPDAIVAMDSDYRIIEWNPGAERLFEYSKQETIGQNIDYLVTNSDVRQEAIDFTQKALNGKDVGPVEIVRYRKDGSPVNVILAGSPILVDKELIGVVAVYTDITELKQAEDLLRAQHNLALQLGATVGLDETLRLCVKAAIHNTEMDAGGVYLVDETSGDLDLSYFTGLSPDFVTATSHYSADMPNTRLIMAGQPIYVNYQELDVPMDETRRDEGLRAIAILPVHYEGRVIACLNIASHSLAEIPAATRNTLETIAAQIGSFVARARAEEGQRQALAEALQATYALRESEERLNLVLRGADLGLWDWNIQTGKVILNDRWAEMLGYALDELAPHVKTWEDLVHPDDLPGAMETLNAHLEGKTSFYETEHRMRAKDGSWKWILARGKVMERDDQGRSLRAAGTHLDITERKRAEEERERLLVQIQEQARRMQQIMDTVPEGVLLLDTSGQIILANPVARRHLDSLAGARTGDTLTHLGNRPLAEFLTSPPKGLWHEAAIDDKVFDLIARPMEHGPEPEDWVLIINDVTQQREIERRIQHQERLAAVGQLAAGIAHDFNNIMAAIVLYAQMTARLKELPATVRERMETINQQAGHASKLIQQILDFSRRAVLNRQPLDLTLLLKEHIRLLKRTLPENIEIELVYEHITPLTINADPTRMQQIVTNLSVNARDAMPEGGILHIGLERIEIKPGESPLLPEIEPGEWVQMTVSDTGTGILPDALPHIFEPFFTTKGPGIGSGLGLAQVHGIVGQHGGRIDVETQVGKGTTFTIYLPALSTPEEPLAISSQDLSLLPSGQGQIILVVEDDAVVRKVLKESLATLNYQVLEAANGQEALAMLEQHGDNIDLLLSDVVMPEMGGKALLHTLKEKRLTIPMVMLTGHPLEKEMEELRAQGMVDWLPKPPDLDKLAEVVARALKKD